MEVWIGTTDYHGDQILIVATSVEKALDVMRGEDWQWEFDEYVRDDDGEWWCEAFDGHANFTFFLNRYRVEE